MKIWQKILTWLAGWVMIGILIGLLLALITVPLSHILGSGNVDKGVNGLFILVIFGLVVVRLWRFSRMRDAASFWLVRKHHMTRIIVPNVAINGHPVRLVLDTGAFITMLTDSKARRLGLKSTRLFHIKVNSTQGLIALSSEPACVTMSGSTFTTQLPILKLPWYVRSKEFDGFLGWSEIRHSILAFDATCRTVTSIKDFPMEATGWSKFKLRSSAVLALEILLPNDQTGTILVDTGIPWGVCLPSARWMEWKLTGPKPFSRKSPIVSYMLGAKLLLGMEIWAEEIKLGNLTLTKLPVCEANAVQGANIVNYAGSLGLGALARMDLIVDGKNGFAYIRPKLWPGPIDLDPKCSEGNNHTTHGPHGNEHWLMEADVPLKSDCLLAFPYFSRAVSKINTGDHDGAIDDLNQAIEFDPKDVKIYLTRSLAKIKKGDFEGAINDCIEVLQIEPQNATAYTNRGNAKMTQGDYCGAIADYTNVLEIDPRNADAFASRGIARQIRGDFANALADLDNAVQLVPNDSPYLHLYFQIFHIRLYKTLPDFNYKTAKWKNSWAKTLKRFLAGRIDETVLLVAAEKRGLKPLGEQKCEAYYFIGIMRLVNHDEIGACEFLKRCATTGMKYCVAHPLACAELTRLESLKNK